MKPFTSARLMATLLLLAPLPVLVYANGNRLIRSGDIEPFADNLFMYVLLLIVFGAAAAALAIYHSQRGPKLPLVRDVAIYTLVGVAGSTLFMVFMDYNESYFSQPGVGWIWPAAGVVSGASLGAIFRIAYHGLGPHTPAL